MMLAAPICICGASALKEANIDPDALKIGDPLTYDVSSTGDGKTRASNVQRA